MKIYIAICTNRHMDEDIKVFTQLEKAIQYAKDFMEDNITKNGHIEEQKISGWEYYATYSIENDCVRVEEGELNDN